MLHRQTWLLVLAFFLVITSSLFVALPRTGASSLVAREPGAVSVSQTRGSLSQMSAVAPCAYSPHTEIIIDYDHWSKAAYYCGTGMLAHEIDHVNEIYNSGGDTMWVKWYTSPTGHYCVLKNQGDYWDFPSPAKITQIDYGDNPPARSYCG